MRHLPSLALPEGVTEEVSSLPSVACRRKVFGLSWSRGSGATLRQVLERGLESCKDMRAAGEEAHRKASKLGDSDIRAFSLR